MWRDILVCSRESKRIVRIGIIFLGVLRVGGWKEGSKKLVIGKDKE
jgi:hypothetical protein